MKRFSCILLAVLCIACIAGCAKQSNPDETTACALVLDSNPTTGYEWTFSIADPSIVSFTQEFESDATDDAVGVGGREVLTFTGLKAGVTTLTATYAQPWDAESGTTSVYFIKVDDQKQVTCTETTPYTLTKDANPTTGYDWAMACSDEAVVLCKSVYVQTAGTEDMDGAGGTTTFTFYPLQNGTATVTLTYARAWETDTEPQETVTLQFTVEDGVLTLQ